MNVLITSVSGRLGRAVAEQLVSSGHRVLGLDLRPWKDPPAGVELFTVDLRKRAAEEVFRQYEPAAVVHMATVSHLHVSEPGSHRLSLGGTKAIIDYCSRYGVRRAIFVGRHTYYGATADSPLYHTEDEPPMAAENFPELADLIAADLFAGSALWRHSQFDTAVLRLCYTLGPSQRGTLADYLRGPRVPTVMGYDPLFQFMHESDAARAIATAVLSRIRGVFNVAGPAPLPLSTIIEETGRVGVAVPESMLVHLFGKLGFPKLPPGAISHLKYPIVTDPRPFQAATGFQPNYDEYDAMRAFREQSLPPSDSVAPPGPSERDT